MSGMEVHKVSYAIPVPHPEMLAEAQAIWSAFEGFMNATPEQRAQWAEEQQRERAIQRDAAERRPLTLDGLLDKLGFSQAYAEHLMQPYCDCMSGGEGWDYCAHAYDEGLTR